MSPKRYDAIVVGARAAGASTAMLLAKSGLRVLAVDRAPYGSDTLSTHALMRPAVLQLARWGLLDAVRASGAPAIRRVRFHYPGESLGVDIKPADGVDALYAPRRTVLDRILADAARNACAEVRFGISATDLMKDEHGRVTGVFVRDEESERAEPLSAGIVIGADGTRSMVARFAGAQTLREATSDGAAVYGYFGGIDADGYEWAYGEGASAGFIPTNEGEVCVFVGMTTSRFRKAMQPDISAGFCRTLEAIAPDLARRVARAEQRSRLRGFADVRGFYRKPSGPGWALVGDAGYFRDPITTHGISDAFRDAELLSRAITGASSFEEYEAIRNDVTREMFEVTDRIASYAWNIAELKSLLLRVSRAMRPETELLLGFDAAAAVA